MKKVIYPFLDNYDILQNDLQDMEDYRVDEIKSLIEAIMSSKGIASGFTNSNSIATGFTVTTGVMYSGDGERIEKLENEAIVMTGYDVTKTYYLMCKYVSQTTTPQQNPVSGLSADTRQENVSPKISNGGLWVSATDESTTLEYVCIGTITYSNATVKWTLNVNTSDRNVFAVYSQTIELPLSSVTHVQIGTLTNYFGDLFIKDGIYFCGTSGSSIFGATGKSLNLSSDTSITSDIDILPKVGPQPNDSISVGSIASRFDKGYFNSINLRALSVGGINIFGKFSLSNLGRIDSDTDITIPTGFGMFFGSYRLGDVAGQGLCSYGDFLPDSDGGFNLGSSVIPKYWNFGYFNNIRLKDGSGNISTVAGELNLSAFTNVRLNPTGLKTYFGAANAYYIDNNGYASMYESIAAYRFRGGWLYNGGSIDIQGYDNAADSVLKIWNEDSGKVMKARWWYDTGKYFDAYVDSSSRLNLKSNVLNGGIRLRAGAAGGGYLDIAVDGSAYSLLSPSGDQLQIFDSSSYFDRVTRALIGMSFVHGYDGVCKVYNSPGTNYEEGKVFHIAVGLASNGAPVLAAGLADKDVVCFSLSILIEGGVNAGLWHVNGTNQVDFGATQWIAATQDQAAPVNANNGIFAGIAPTTPYIQIFIDGSIRAYNASVATTKMIITGIITSYNYLMAV